MHRPQTLLLLLAALAGVVLFLLHLVSDGTQAAHIVAKVKGNTPAWLTPSKPGTTWTAIQAVTEVDDDRSVNNAQLMGLTDLYLQAMGIL